MSHFGNEFPAIVLAGSDGVDTWVDVPVDTKDGWIDAYHISGLYGSRFVSQFMQSGTFDVVSDKIRELFGLHKNAKLVEFYSRDGQRNLHKADQSSGTAMMHPLMFVVYVSWLGHKVKSEELAAKSKIVFIEWLLGSYTNNSPNAAAGKIKRRMKTLFDELQTLVGEGVIVWGETDEDTWNKLKEIGPCMAFANPRHSEEETETGVNPAKVSEPVLARTTIVHRRPHSEIQDTTALPELENVAVTTCDAASPFTDRLSAVEAKFQLLMAAHRLADQVLVQTWDMMADLDDVIRDFDIGYYDDNPQDEQE